MKRFKGTRGTIFLAIAIALVVIAYYMISSDPGEKSEEEIAVSEAQTLLLRDLDRDYPPSPKEVLKYYSDITKAFYKTETSVEEIEELAIRSRELFDSELKSSITEEQFIIDLKEEIVSFNNAETKISSYALSSSSDVEYFSEDGFEFARLYAHYTLSRKGEMQTVDEVFILRKDDEGHWKIYGWGLMEDTNLE